MKTIKSQGGCLSLFATILMVGAAAFNLTSCEQYDLDERMPEELGTSIYGFLDENGFETYKKLINEPGLAGTGQSYREVLEKTGSKTLFVADEEAVGRFYKSGVFKKADGSNVECYEDLSLSQKKMLLFGAMLDNVYQAAMLSSREDENGGSPVRGDCMRRISLLTEIYDTVTYMTPDQMPDNQYWKALKTSGEGIRCMTDATKRPRVMFTPKFLEVHQLTNEDYDFLFHRNDGKHRTPEEVSINGIRIMKADNKCLNGFVHVMEEVVCPLQNMAEKLNTSANAKIYNALVRRFSAPFVEFPMDGDDEGYVHTATFNTLYNTDYDHIYQMRFLSARSQVTPSAPDGDSLYYTSRYIEPARKNVKKLILKYDPGWNEYFTPAGGIDASIALQKDMAVMLVPNDEAMEKWWNDSPLKERYGIGSTPEERRDHKVHGAAEVIEDMAGVPDEDIKELINNGMLESLMGSVPSRFDNILNDAQDPMGIEIGDVDAVEICCNGALYYINRVFPPTTFKSVLFPTVVDKSIEVIKWAIDNLGFKPYLNSMVSTYSFFIPKGVDVPELGWENCIIYLSPVIESVEDKFNSVYVFHFNTTNQTVEAKRYVYNKDTKKPDYSQVLSEKVSAEEIENILTDLLDYHIVIGDVEDSEIFGQPSQFTFFKTKGGGNIKFALNGTGESAERLVWGGYQLQQKGQKSVTFNRVYDQKDKNTGGNGRAYVLDEPLYSSSQTVTEVLLDSNNPEFNTFGEFIMLSSLYQETGQKLYGGTNLSVFNTYNYTVYVPRSADLDKLVKERKIVTPNDIEKLKTYYEELTKDYDPAAHGGKTQDEYEQEIGIKLYKAMYDNPSKIDSTYNVETYLKDLTTEFDNYIKYHIQDNSLFIGSEFEESNYETSYMIESDNVFAKLSASMQNGTINVNDGSSNHKVVNNNEQYYNIMCREFEYKASYAGINTSSYAVVHLIDSPLDYSRVSKFGYGERVLYFEFK